MVKKARLGGLTTALDLIQVEDDGRRRAKEELEVRRRTWWRAAAATVAQYMLAFWARAAPATGRKWSGSRFQSNRVTRSAAASAAQNMRHIRELSRRNHLRELTLDEHEQLEKPQLAAGNTLASTKNCVN